MPGSSRTLTNPSDEDRTTADTRFKITWRYKMRLRGVGDVPVRDARDELRVTWCLRGTQVNCLTSPLAPSANVRV